MLTAQASLVTWRTESTAATPEFRSVEPSFIIQRVLCIGEADLLDELPEAGGLSALFAGPVQGGQEHGGQDAR